MTADADGRTILVAEDDPGIVDLLTVILGDTGANVVAAANGAEAVAKARACEPDLILLDVMMPEMDGWEVATRLLTDAKTADVPIIFLTARATPAEQMRGWSMPIFEYITKPFDIDDLVAKVRSVLESEKEQRPELRERLRKEKLRALLGMEQPPEHNG